MYKYKVTLLILLIILLYLLYKHQREYFDRSIIYTSNDFLENDYYGIHFKYMDRNISQFRIDSSNYVDLEQVPKLKFLSYNTCPNLYYLFHGMKSKENNKYIRGENTQGIEFRNDCEKIFYNTTLFVRTEHPIIDIEAVDTHIEVATAAATAAAAAAAATAATTAATAATTVAAAATAATAIAADTTATDEAIAAAIASATAAEAAAAIAEAAATDATAAATADATADATAEATAAATVKNSKNYQNFTFDCLENTARTLSYLNKYNDTKKIFCNFEKELKQIFFKVKSNFDMDDILRYVDFCFTQLCFGMIYIEKMRLTSNHYRVFPCPCRKGAFFILPERIRHQVSMEGKEYTRAKCNTCCLNLIVLFGTARPEKFDFIYEFASVGSCYDSSDIFKQDLDSIEF